MKTPHQSTLIDRVTQYANDVLAGRVIAGPHVRASCKRHIEDIKNGESRGLYWDESSSQRIINFFSDVLRLSEGQFDGEPFYLHDSQAFIVGSLFGWKRADGSRRFRRAYIEQGKGNGKSPLVAGIGLYGLLADNEPGAQIYAAAAKMEQARVLYNDAVQMVRRSPALKKRLTLSGVNPVYNIIDNKTGGFFKPLGRDTGKTGSGLRPHFVLLDELHEHPNRSTLEILERGFKFRRQPLIVMITNSGSDKNSVCWEEHEHAVNVAHGETEDDTTFSFVCAVDADDDPLNDEKCWEKVNPLIEKTITKQYLSDVAAQAKAIPGKANNILRLHFCQWTDSDKAWITRETWEACEDASLKIEDFIGRKMYIGLDLGATRDMTARAMVFDDGYTKDGQRKYVLFAHAYTPADTLRQRMETDRAPYDVWVDQGYITATPGSVVRFDRVAYDIVDISSSYEIAAVAYDRWLIRQFEVTLDEMGVTLPLVEHPQGTNRRQNSQLSMPESIDLFEELLLEKRIRIAVNPALRSAVSSAVMWTSPAGLRRFEKNRATARIDLCVAAAMAVGAAGCQQETDISDFINNPLIV